MSHIPLSGDGGKDSARRRENKARVSRNWPYPDPFELKQAERRAKEKLANGKNAQQTP